MVLHDPQEFGGLEEYTATLAIGLQQQGHPTSVLTTNWVSPENQYLRRLRDNNVPLAQIPKWISYPASHWPTKEKLLSATLWLLTPLIYILGLALYLLRRRSWEESVTSARGWLCGYLLAHIFGPDRRELLTRLLLAWWSIRWNPDVFHIQGYTTALLFVIDWASSRGVPVVYEEHQTPDAQFDWWKGFQKSINKASIVVAVSEKSAQALRTVCGVTRPVVVRNPLLPDPLQTGWQKNEQRGVSLPGETINITTIARLDVAKGLNYLLEAIVLVRQAHPAAQFRVYGNGRLRDELLAYAAQLGLDGESIFVGAYTERQELARIMAETDIFAMPSILEGQPLGVVEAMAFGCPIVTTSVGGIPELIRDGINGLLCMPRDPACLAEKINQLIEDPALRARLSIAARKTYEQGPFQPESVCNHFVAIYNQALDKESLAFAV